ncbi:hypothetical protein F4820DRAFT_466658 [Hypoxylon rubiginosum]|uniref:Uncharacterized protein n=1 Tax=Hypoxylon rubiginosum TaxID=110542 RepID=A0ACB9Z8Z5_9PEZI|nr:hypothetical protein F4820DRAFT_466658 [Hypoxylon rubiginosum]
MSSRMTRAASKASRASALGAVTISSSSSSHHSAPGSDYDDLENDEENPSQHSERDSEADIDELAGSQPSNSPSDAEVDAWDDVSATSDEDLERDDTIMKYPVGYTEQDSPDWHPTNKQKVLLAHFDGLPGSLQNVALVATQHIARMERKASEWLEDHSQRVTMKRCRRAFPEVQYDVNWTEDDEGKLRDTWDDDPIKARLEQIDVRKNRDIIPTWKIFFRFLKCFPTDVISRRNHLEYYGTFEDDDGNTLADPNWTKNFCRRLGRLALHGVFQLQSHLLTLALQYVVICRRDYRGRVPWTNRGTDGFLDMFLVRMREQNGSKSVVRIHKEILSHLAAGGMEPTSHISELFTHIENRAFKKAESPFRPEQVPIFQLTPEDLAILIRAANAIRPGGVSSFVHLSIVWRISTIARKALDAPSNAEELNELREQIILRDRRVEKTEAHRHNRVQPANDDDKSEPRLDSDVESTIEPASKRRRLDLEPAPKSNELSEAIQADVLARIGEVVYLTADQRAAVAAILAEPSQEPQVAESGQDAPQIDDAHRMDDAPQMEDEFGPGIFSPLSPSLDSQTTSSGNSADPASPESPEGIVGSDSADGNGHEEAPIDPVLEPPFKDDLAPINGWEYVTTAFTPTMAPIIACRPRRLASLMGQSDPASSKEVIIKDNHPYAFLLESRPCTRPRYPDSGSEED